MVVFEIDQIDGGKAGGDQRQVVVFNVVTGRGREGVLQSHRLRVGINGSDKLWHQAIAALLDGDAEVLVADHVEEDAIVSPRLLTVGVKDGAKVHFVRSRAKILPVDHHETNPELLIRRVLFQDAGEFQEHGYPAGAVVRAGNRLLPHFRIQFLIRGRPGIPVGEEADSDIRIIPVDFADHVVHGQLFVVHAPDVRERLEKGFVARLGEFGLDPVAAVVVGLGGGNSKSEGALLLQIREGTLLIEVYDDLGSLLQLVGDDRRRRNLGARTAGES